MRYLKWKLSELGESGTGPEAVLNEIHRIGVGAYMDSDGYRIGYVPDFDISRTDDEGQPLIDAQWDVTEVTEAEALAFCQQLDAEAAVGADGRINNPAD